MWASTESPYWAVVLAPRVDVRIHCRWVASSAFPSKYPNLEVPKNGEMGKTGEMGANGGGGGGGGESSTDQDGKSTNTFQIGRKWGRNPCGQKSRTCPAFQMRTHNPLARPHARLRTIAACTSHGVHCTGGTLDSITTVQSRCVCMCVCVCLCRLVCGHVDVDGRVWVGGGSINLPREMLTGRVARRRSFLLRSALDGVICKLPGAQGPQNLPVRSFGDRGSCGRHKKGAATRGRGLLGAAVGQATLLVCVGGGGEGVTSGLVPVDREGAWV